MFERAENYNPVSGVDDQTANTPVGKVLKALGTATPSPAGGPWVKSGGKEYATDANGMIVPGVSRAGPAIIHASPPSPLNWDVGPGWDSFNKSLPVGPAGNTDASKNVTVGGTTNNITVNSPDAHSAAAMVGMHLDRTANDISRNLQGAFQ
jgi:hypothetical protein